MKLLASLASKPVDIVFAVVIAEFWLLASADSLEVGNEVVRGCVLLSSLADLSAKDSILC